MFFNTYKADLKHTVFWKPPHHTFCPGFVTVFNVGRSNQDLKLKSHSQPEAAVLLDISYFR